MQNEKTDFTSLTSDELKGEVTRFPFPRGFTVKVEAITGTVGAVSGAAIGHSTGIAGAAISGFFGGGVLGVAVAPAAIALISALKKKKQKENA